MSLSLVEGFEHWFIMPRGGATAYGSLFVCHSVRCRHSVSLAQN